MMKKFIGFVITLIMCMSLLSFSAFAKDVEVNGNTFAIKEDFDVSTIPEGFTKAEISFEGTNMTGIANSDDTEFKFYLESASDSSLSGWYTYLGKGKFAATSGENINFVGGSLVVEEPDSDVVIPKGIVASTVNINGHSYPAYVLEDEKDEVGLSEYFLYGTLDGTEHAWFQYNLDDNMAVKISIDRYGRMLAYEKSNKSLTKKLEKLNNKYNRNIKKSKYMFLFMCVCTMLFFFLMINAMIKRKHQRLDMEDRILDLRLHKGRDTMKISRKDLEKRQKKDLKAMERNDIDPEAIRSEDIRRRATSPLTPNINRPSNNNNDDDVLGTNPKKKPKLPKEKSKEKDETYDLDLKSIEDNINDISKAKDIDDDLEFVSLDF